MTQIHRELVKLYQDFDIQFNQYNEIIIVTQEQLDTIETVKDVPGANFRIETQEAIELYKKIFVYVERPLPKTGLFVSQNLKKLVETYPLTPPQNYYLIDSKDANFLEKNAAMDSYELISSFLRKIQGDCIIFNETTKKITFIGEKQKFIAPCNYSVEQHIDKIQEGLNKLDSLFEIVKNDLEQLNSILSEEIIYTIKSSPKENALNVMLSNIENILESATQNYKKYKADFSYKKFLDEVRKNHLENYTKLHKVFSDIQAHLIGLPIASFISATQIKKGITENGDFYTNIIILLSIIIYLLFTYIAVNNQSDTLKHVESQIENEKEKLLLCLEEQEVKKIYKLLDNRIKKQGRILLFMKLIIIISAIICILFYLKQSNLLIPIIDKLYYWCINIKLLWNIIHQTIFPPYPA